MIDEAEKRGQIIRHLEDALALADEIADGMRRLSTTMPEIPRPPPRRRAAS
jgi:hypothetical protein